ncbi:MAG TPA: serine/threonine-protein kinase [Gemmatimonadaceae bacterium]|nr:serine/threonine-protein kinase [Gemmatimonadaceae bacterium]
MAATRAQRRVTPERWAEVKAIVASALELPLDERDGYVHRACGSDDELCAEVRSLLAASEGTDSIPGAREAVAAARQNFASEGDSALRSLIERALGAQYEIVRPLGRGGMGAVYLARERALERLVAVKVLRPDLAEAAESRERFRREARVAAQLSHPGILPLHAFSEIDGIWYFVMGYVRGQSLAERLRLEGAMQAGDVRRILIELTDAIEWAHRHGVIHRDIKPANILLDDESGRTILADFGISKLKDVADSLTATGAVWGSPHYMSPEQGIGSSDLDERSDLYSLGAVAYTMLAGREPFAGVGVEDLSVWRLTHDPAPLLSVAPSVPEDLAAVVMRSLARDRTARWPSALELREALGRTSGVAATALPEPVRDLPSFGPYAVLWAVAWAALAVITIRSPGDRALLLLVAILVPVGLLLHVWNIGRHGLGPLELARIASWPPEWWGMWWPKALRRPNDLWSRLPWQARLVRGVLSAFLLALPAVVLTRQWLTTTSGPRSGGIRHDLFVAGEIALVAGTTSVIAAALWWTKRRGLTLADGSRVLFGATTPSPAWNQPHVARLLHAPPGSVRPPDRDSAPDHRRAIGDLVTLLPPESNELGALAVRAARELGVAVDVCDRELAVLARDASPAEVQRLESQLSALEPASSVEASDRRELRGLVVHQLEVVRRMHARSESVGHRRAHLLHLMRGLWAQLSLARSAPSAAANDRLRALCAEIAEEASASLPAKDAR